MVDTGEQIQDDTPFAVVLYQLGYGNGCLLHGCASLRCLDERGVAGYDDDQLQLLEDCLKPHLRDAFRLRALLFGNTDAVIQIYRL